MPSGITNHNTLALAVEGYATAQSYQPGDEVAVCCSSVAPSFSVEVARVGATREVVWSRAGIPGRRQEVPGDAWAEGCGWEPTFSFTAGAGWRSGYYEVALRADGVSGPEAGSQAWFALRPAPNAAPRAPSPTTYPSNRSPRARSSK